MLPTVAEVLALDPVRSGAPRVLAGAERLEAPVRWVHVIELAQAAHLLRGGELVLSTGIALPEDGAGLQRYVAELAAVGVSALAVELGSRYSRSLPSALIAAAGEHRLPLIVLERETQFIEITEAVHARIIDAQLSELRSAERLHQVFTELAVSGAAADEVVAQAAALAGCPVILESLVHQVLACAPGTHDAAILLAGFAGRSRAVRVPGRTGYDAAAGWLVTTVGARGEDWGRLIMLRGSAPEPGDVALLERAATTLALCRLLDRHEQSLERQAHRTILAAFLGHGYSDQAEAEARARALGVPVTGRSLVAVVVGLAAAPAGLGARARAAAVAESLAEVCRLQRVPALVAALDTPGAAGAAPRASTAGAPGTVSRASEERVGALLALPPRSDADAVLTRLAGQLRPRLGGQDVIAAGTSVDSVTGVQQSFLEADHVASAAAGLGSHMPYFRLADLRLRGLLHLLRDDPRVHAFAERELGPLLAHDDAGGPQLLAALQAYLCSGGNKAEAAKQAHLARPTMYERLRQIEDVLGIDLEPAESRLSLHVALLALQAAGTRHT
jgi:PucR family transcriptional regulator, purine catabolism regulatory protein